MPARTERRLQAVATHVCRRRVGPPATPATAAQHSGSGSGSGSGGSSAVVDVVIVGAGVNGVGTARRLAEEGLDVAVLERQAEVGGIWSEFANDSSRSQNHEPAYRLGASVGVEDYTQKPQVIADLWRGARELGIAERIRCGAEVVRVIDEPGASPVRVLFRTPEETGDELHSLEAGHVIFCTGSLQKPRNPPLTGEDAFGGPVVLGLGSAVNALEFAGKVVTVVGMGAFAIENARLALLSGAAHVHMVARTRVRVTSRFTRVLNILASAAFYHKRGEGRGVGLPPLDREELSQRQYVTSSAEDAWPDRTDRSTTPWTTSDIFFLAHSLGKLTVHKGTVESLQPGAAVVVVGKGAEGAGESREIPCDIVVKNLGFEGVDIGDRMGGVCEVVGHRSCRPPIWITERVLTFRHQTDLPRDLPEATADRLGQEALAAELADLSGDLLRKHTVAAGVTIPDGTGEQALRDQLWDILSTPSDEEEASRGEGSKSSASQGNFMGGAEVAGWVGPNWVGSAPHGTGVWTEIFLHFRERPEALADLFTRLPRTALSATGGADISRGMRTVLGSDESLLGRVNANRDRLNQETWQYYAPPAASLEEAQREWVGGFLRRNKEDWEEACEAMAGDSKAVAYLWEDVAEELGIVWEARDAGEEPAAR